MVLIRSLWVVALGFSCVACAQGPLKAQSIVPFTSADAGTVKFVSNAALFSDNMHGVLLEDEMCFGKSIGVTLDDAFRHSEQGRALEGVLLGGGEFGPRPKYVYISGSISLRKNVDGVLEGTILTVNGWKEQPVDIKARLARIDSQRDCQASQPK